jgi:hypothetical protein
MSLLNSVATFAQSQLVISTWNLTKATSNNQIIQLHECTTSAILKISCQKIPEKKNICTAFSSIAHFIIEDQHEQGLFDGRYDYSETS